MPLAKIAVQCKRKKNNTNDMKKRNKVNEKFETKAKLCVTKKSISEETPDQTFVDTNPVDISDKVAVDQVEEAKCTWNIGKSLALCASNDDDVINALRTLHMEKEDGTKRPHAKGRKGRK